MKYFCTLLALFSFAYVGQMSAAPVKEVKEFKDYAFQQERMQLTSDGIYIISSFEDSDKLTAYSYGGDRQWELSFHAKIVSWQVAGGYLFVFSKGRSGTKTYLTCIDRILGTLVWEK